MKLVLNIEDKVSAMFVFVTCVEHFQKSGKSIRKGAILWNTAWKHCCRDACEQKKVTRAAYVGVMVRKGCDILGRKSWAHL